MTSFKNAIGYIRVSTEQQADDDKYGVESQKQAILLYANNQGYHIVDWKIDDAARRCRMDAPFAYVAFGACGINRCRNTISAPGSSISPQKPNSFSPA